jgi:protein-S-isoprenylcysteine O-methyltransferase Ste14
MVDGRLLRRSLVGFLELVGVMALCLFLSAGTLGYWQGWVFLSLFSGMALVITVYLAVKDPALLERRVNAGPTAEKEKTQRIIQSIASVAFLAILIVPSLDHRFGWSRAPGWVVVMGDFLVVLGYLIIFWVFRENTFTAATIDVAPEQRVISTGPYATVRHPMYAGGLVLLLGIPLSLGSWWGMASFVPIAAAIVWRLLDEEKVLRERLAGYDEYCAKTRYHLLPGIW